MSRRYTLTRQDMKVISRKLYLYREIDNAIAVRKRELEVKKSYDNNIGGGKSNKISKPVEELVMKWDADPQIQNFNNFRKIVEDLMKSLDDISKEVFHYQWIDDNYYTEEEIAKKCFTTDRTVRRKKRAILEKYDKLCGGFW